MEQASTIGMQRSGAGIALILVGVAALSVQDIIVKQLSTSYPIMEFVFFRTLFSIPFIVIIAFLDAGRRAFRVRQPALHFLRGTLLFMAYATYFLTIASVPLATAVTLVMVAPMLTTACVAIFLGEPVGVRRWCGIAVGFGGVLLVLQPGMEAFDPGGLIGLLAALIYALSIVLTRKLGASEPGSSLLISQTFVYLALSAIAGLVMRDIPVSPDDHSAVQFLLRAWTMPAMEHMLLMAFCGCIVAIGFYCITQAYRIAAPSVVAPFEYSGMIWGVTWGFLFWSEVPGTLAFMGMTIILASGLYIAHREAVRAPVDTGEHFESTASRDKIT